MLKKFTSDDVDKWDKYLPYVLFAYREVSWDAWIGQEALQTNAISYVLETRW